MTDSRRRWRWGAVWLGLVLVTLVGVMARCVWLQYFHGEVYQQKAQRQQLKIIPQTAQRGAIVDREGRMLAMSVPTFSVAVDPEVLEDMEGTVKLLAGILRVKADELRQPIMERMDKQFCWVARKVTEEQVKKIRDLKIKGVILQKEFDRQYPMGPMAAHVLGYCTVDGQGLEGIEKRYDEDLAPRSGQWVLSSDALRRPIGVQGECTDAQDGNTVVLTLDTVIQNALEQQLAATVKKFGAKDAIGIVMEPYSGEILGMAVYPAFDPADAGQISPERRRNRILTDPVECGSVFKPFTVGAGLAADKIKPHEVIYCEDGSYSGKGYGTIREYDNHRYGNMTITEIITKSSNIGVAKIAQKMGKPIFYQKMRDFGFGERTGIDLDGEDPGIMRPLSEWKDKEYTLTRAAFGQALAVTPIQLIRAFCCFCNGGKQVRPRLVRGVLSPDLEVVKDFGHPEKAGSGDKLKCSSPAQMKQFLHDAFRTSGVDGGEKQVIPSNVARLMAEEIMRPVVDLKEGTGHRAYLEGYGVFGKTGTGQVPVKGGRGYETNKYISSFIAGAPSWDPRVCVLVMVREPNRSLGLGYTGGVVSAPAVREILKETLAYLGVEPRSEKAERVGTESGPSEASGRPSD